MLPLLVPLPLTASKVWGVEHMQRSNEKAHRANGGPSDALVRECPQQSSPIPRERIAQIELWVHALNATEIGVLLLLMRHQSDDGSAFMLRHHDVATHLFGLHARQRYWQCVNAMQRLRAFGLVQVTVQGDKRNPNHYRVPNPLPTAPPVTIVKKTGPARKRIANPTEDEAREFAKRHIDGIAGVMELSNRARANGISFKRFSHLVRAVVKFGFAKFGRRKQKGRRGRPLKVLELAVQP
jgi:hypothetical protein